MAIKGRYHCEIEKVRVYKIILEYLWGGNEEDDILVDTCLYKNSNNSINKTIEVSDNKINIDWQSTINILLQIPQPAKINTS